MVVRRRRSVGDAIATPRPKIEVIVGIPHSGRGADISLMGGRKMNFAGASVRSESEEVRDAKFSFDTCAIEHQFTRRHYSCPPPSVLSTDTRKGFREALEHEKRSEAYARLLGRSGAENEANPIQRAPWNPNFRKPSGVLGRVEKLADLEPSQESPRAHIVTVEDMHTCSPAVFSDSLLSQLSPALPTTLSVQTSPLYIKPHLRQAPNSWMSDSTADTESSDSGTMSPDIESPDSGGMSPSGTLTPISEKTPPATPWAIHERMQPLPKNLAEKRRQEKMLKLTPKQLQQAQRRSAWNM